MTPLKLRPMHHRATPRIRAHVLMCALPMVCWQEVEHRTGRRFDTSARLFRRVQAVMLQQGNSRF